MAAVDKIIASLTGAIGSVRANRKDIAHLRWSEFANPIGWSPLLSSAFYGSIATVKLLTDFGCPIERASQAGHSALMVAALRGHDAVVRVLAERSDFTKEEPEALGYTAFHFACRSCSLDTVRFLVTAGADVNAISLFGASPLSVAESSSRVETVEYLRSLNASEGDANADAKFNILRAAITSYSGTAKDKLFEDMSFHTIRTNEQRFVTVADSTLIRYFGCDWRSYKREHLNLEVAALDDAIRILGSGRSTEEVYVAVVFTFARFMMPYLVLRKGKEYVAPPLYLATESYSEYLIEAFQLVEAGIDCAILPPMLNPTPPR